MTFAVTKIKKVHPNSPSPAFVVGRKKTMFSSACFATFLLCRNIILWLSVPQMCQRTKGHSDDYVIYYALERKYDSVNIIREILRGTPRDDTVSFNLTSISAFIKYCLVKGFREYNITVSGRRQLLLWVFYA